MRDCETTACNRNTTLHSSDCRTRRVNRGAIQRQGKFVVVINVIAIALHHHGVLDGRSVGAGIVCLCNADFQAVVMEIFGIICLGSHVLPHFQEGKVSIRSRHKSKVP